MAIELSLPDVFVDVSTSNVVYRFGGGLLVGRSPMKLYRGIRLNRAKSVHFIRNVLSALLCHSMLSTIYFMKSNVL